MRAAKSARAWRGGAWRREPVAQRPRWSIVMNQTFMHTEASAMSQRGMSLIEIMVVLVIIGLAATLISVAVLPQLGEAQIKKARLDIKKLESALDLYKIEERSYPDNLSALVPKYIKKLEKDPWDMDYVYMKTGDGYEIISYGPNKTQGGGDDISSNEGATATK